MSTLQQHADEVQKGRRFEFGKNWRRFLSRLNEERIIVAENSLKTFLKADRLDGKTFLDMGSGSGLFSLAARRLGAAVRSFDYDPQSVACTRELRRRYFPADKDWIVEQGSALDRDYLSSLGTFDIVYSWGVLHHTGAMWQALENVKPLAKIGGQLFIAIYNDLGAVTDDWRLIKQRYNSLPRSLRLPYALTIIRREEYPTLRNHYKRGDLKSYVRQWSEYSLQSTRGMSRWHDWIDWIGGYPYECATIEAIVDFFGKDGFALEKLESRASGIGCNEFVFRRRAELGTFIDNPLPASRIFTRRFGRRITPPFTLGSRGYVAQIPSDLRSASSLVLFRNGVLIGSAERVDQYDAVIVAPAEWPSEEVEKARIEVAHARLVTVPPAVQSNGGNMFSIAFPDLASCADDTSPTGQVSPLFVFEDGRQLAFPHSLHADLTQYGAGRFSHWGQYMLFSSSDNTDPRTNGRTYELVIAESG
jgi:2-polyprenyl-3-methyl-5-hydroxy-6-metoxy-1,4-benzoquinol methylase